MPGRGVLLRLKDERVNGGSSCRVRTGAVARTLRWCTSTSAGDGIALMTLPALRPCRRLHGGGNDVRGARGQGSPGAPAGAGAGGTHTHERAVLGIGRRRRSRPWERRSKRPRRRRHSRARREVEREAGGRRAISRNACLEICRLPFPASFRGTRIYAPPAPPFLFFPLPPG
jgi:hypothetical protein